MACAKWDQPLEGDLHAVQDKTDIFQNAKK